MIGAVLVFRDVTERRYGPARRSRNRSRDWNWRWMRAGWAPGIGKSAPGNWSWSANLERIHGMDPGSFGGRFEDFQKDIHPEDSARVLASAAERGLPAGRLTAWSTGSSGPMAA